jgi:hypothetical protein
MNLNFTEYANTYGDVGVCTTIGSFPGFVSDCTTHQKNGNGNSCAKNGYPWLLDGGRNSGAKCAAVPICPQIGFSGSLSPAVLEVKSHSNDWDNRGRPEQHTDSIRTTCTYDPQQVILDTSNNGTLKLTDIQKDKLLQELDEAFIHPSGRQQQPGNRVVDPRNQDVIDDQLMPLLCGAPNAHSDSDKCLNGQASCSVFERAGRMGDACRQWESRAILNPAKRQRVSETRQKICSRDNNMLRYESCATWCSTAPKSEGAIRDNWCNNAIVSACNTKEALDPKNQLNSPYNKCNCINSESTLTPQVKMCWDNNCGTNGTDQLLTDELYRVALQKIPCTPAGACITIQNCNKSQNCTNIIQNIHQVCSSCVGPDCPTLPPPTTDDDEDGKDDTFPWWCVIPTTAAGKASVDRVVITPLVEWFKSLEIHPPAYDQSTHSPCILDLDQTTAVIGLTTTETFQLVGTYKVPTGVMAKLIQLNGQDPKSKDIMGVGIGPFGFKATRRIVADDYSSTIPKWKTWMCLDKRWDISTLSVPLPVIVYGNWCWVYPNLYAHVTLDSAGISNPGDVIYSSGGWTISIPMDAEKLQFTEKKLPPNASNSMNIILIIVVLLLGVALWMYMRKQ